MEGVRREREEHKDRKAEENERQRNLRKNDSVRQ